MARLVLLVALLLLFVEPARAQEQPGADAEAAGAEEEEAEVGEAIDEEIIVLGRREISRRRAELDRELKAMGYKVREREGVTVYRPEISWKPSVHVYDDGYVILRRSPPRFESYIDSESNLRYLACIPPFTIMCIKIGGVTVSQRKLAPQKAEVIGAIQPEIRAWQGAISREVMSIRLGSEVPALLVATWETGAPTEPGEAPAPTIEERRRAILRFWATRADTEEGDAVRAVVADFIMLVIQESDTPATAAEIAAAEAQCRCGPLVRDPAMIAAPLQP